MFQLMRGIVPGQGRDRTRAFFITVGIAVVLEEGEATVCSRIHPD